MVQAANEAPTPMATRETGRSQLLPVTEWMLPITAWMLLGGVLVGLVVLDWAGGLYWIPYHGVPPS